MKQHVKELFYKAKKKTPNIYIDYENYNAADDDNEDDDDDDVCYSSYRSLNLKTYL